MTERIQPILRRESAEARALRPVLGRARVVGAEVVRELAGLKAELDELRQKARVLVESAEQEADSIREAAKKAGEKQGMDQVMRELAQARAEYGRLQAKAEEDMVTLGFHIARRIIGHAIEVQPEILLDMVEQALGMVRGKREILIHVHPEDFQVLHPRRDDFARSLDGVPVYFEADGSLERGGCYIRTESGRIDARLQTQLDVLRDALTQG